LGREAGGLCDVAEAEIPAPFPEDWGIRSGDWFIAGYNSSNIWWSGLVDKIELTGPGNNTIRVSAKGVEHELKNIFPIIDFGKDYEESTGKGDPYGTYQNPTLKEISRTTSSASILKTLWNDWIVGKVRGVPIGSSCDLDAADTGTDAAYLVYDGSVSLYDILNSLAERTGMSWGFIPTDSCTYHTFFFKNEMASFDPNRHRFYYGVNCLEVIGQSAADQIVNGLTVVGASVPAIGQDFTVALTDTQSQEEHGVHHQMLRVPGIRRATDAKIHAAAILDRKRDPATAFQCRCLAATTLSVNGVRKPTIADDFALIYPGRTAIQIADPYGAAYNLTDAQRLMNQIDCIFGEHTIEMAFTLGEAKPKTLSLWKEALLRNAKKRPRLGFTYDASATWTIDNTKTDPNYRMDIASIPGIIEVDNGDGTGTVRVSQDADGGSDTDPYRQLYTGIGIPSGLTVGDPVTIKKFMQDGELTDIATEAPGTTGGGAALDEDAVIALVNYHLQAVEGRISLSNVTTIRDLGATNPASTTDPILEHVDGDGVPRAAIGHIVRVPVENYPALNSNIRAITSAAYNTTVADLLAAYPLTESRLFDNVLKLNPDGKIGLTHEVQVVIATLIYTLYLQTASDFERGLTVAAPNAVTKANA